MPRARRTLRVEAKAIAGVLVALAAITATATADAYCRTTTCPLAASTNPASRGTCFPADFDATCAAMNPPAKNLVLWWRNACVSYDVQQNGTKWVPFNTVVQIVDSAFSQWTQSTCAPDENGNTRVSISATNLGPVACNQVQYSSDQGNQHVILFHDDVWPHDTGGPGGGMVSSSTLGLTTVTFDADTGEIYDVDTEINGTQPLSATDSPADVMYDLPSIITHEMGHFLGLAHSDHTNATMFAFYTFGSTTIRTLTDDDKAGLCAIYPPNGTRSVDVSVSPTQAVSADSCDPTPRHGFQSVCAQPVKDGCALARGVPTAPTTGAYALAALVAAGWARRRRERSVAPPA